MRVLVTDDSATIRMILKGLLKQLQLTDIVEAEDCHKAKDIVAQGGIALLLLDIHMPNSNGLTFLEELRQNPATAALPVIIISSDTTVSQIERAQQLGAKGYIKKPFRIEGLREALSNAVPALPLPQTAK